MIVINFIIATGAWPSEQKSSIGQKVRVMPQSAEFVGAMTDGLGLMEKVAVFYAKYHVLVFEERVALEHKLRVTHREWAKCIGLEQHHVDFLQVLIRELRARFEEWMQKELVARKRWRMHPRDDLNRLLSESTRTNMRMADVIVNQSRKLSVKGQESVEKDVCQVLLA